MYLHLSLSPSPLFVNVVNAWPLSACQFEFLKKNIIIVKWNPKNINVRMDR